jgi:hypothetical protein
VIVPTTSVPILESDKEHAPYCTNDCLYRHATRRKLKLKIAYDLQREIVRMRAQPRVSEQICVTLKMPLGIIKHDSVEYQYYTYFCSIKPSLPVGEKTCTQVL